MENIFVEFLPPWVETGIQPAFYDKESGTVLQQTARMYARVNMLIRMFNKLSKNTKTTVEDYINKFNVLYNYVYDYFDNLDVQEEINNKLDDMTEAGTLQEIITTYIQSNVAWTFDNVAEMKLATNLTDDSFAQTIGFYNANDKGSALYKIRAKTNDDTVDEMTLIALYDNTLVAELIKTDIMNVKQFGAKGDGLTDDTTPIQTALNYNSNINVPAGVYMVNAVTRISPNTNNKIVLDNDAVIKAIANAEDHYEVIYINNVSNVEISGGTIEGDRETHTGTSGEWGQCISVSGGADHIYIHDITLKNGWGDGIYFNTCSNVTTSRVHVDNVRRNGYSLIAVTNFLSEDDLIENTNGTAPQCGVDIEPNRGTDVIDNVVFNRLTTKNNASKGFIIAYGETVTNETPFHIVVNNIFSDSEDGIYFEMKSTTLTGNITFNYPTIVNSRRWGIAGSNYNYSENCRIVINNPIVDNYATAQTSNTGGIYFSSQSSHDGGNLVIKNPIVKTSSEYSATQNCAIDFYSRGVTNPWHQFVLENPIDLGGLGVLISQANGLNITDKLELTRLDITEATNIKNDYHSLVTNAGASSSVRANIAQNTTVKNQTITFRVVEDQTMVLRFTSQYIYPLSSSISQDVTLSGVGTSITIKKISDTEWTVLNQVGNVTV